MVNLWWMDGWILTPRTNPSWGSDTLKPAWHLVRATMWMVSASKGNHTEFFNLFFSERWTPGNRKRISHRDSVWAFPLKSVHWITYPISSHAFIMFWLASAPTIPHLFCPSFWRRRLRPVDNFLGASLPFGWDLLMGSSTRRTRSRKKERLEDF